MFSMMQSHKMLKMINDSLVDLPSPSSISTLWNFGSLLGFCLSMQIMSGLFLAMHYSSDMLLAFDSVSHIMRDVNLGWALRMIHSIGASFFFICLYIHIGRGLYYGSYQFEFVWITGVSIFLLIMATAFLGYVLPWGQMSFWGATVITNLFSAIPIIGSDIVYWLWGGFAVDNATLTRFFAFHFLLPFIISGLSMVHLLFLHQTGSNNPLGLNSNLDKVPFFPYFFYKDVMGLMVFLILFVYVGIGNPVLFGDPENYIPANPLVTPIHIQPEWYFLFAYAILRSIPNKLGGVMALVLAVAILYIMPFYGGMFFKTMSFMPLSRMFFWWLIVIVMLLTWIGARPVEEPYIITGQLLTMLYFNYYLFVPYLSIMQSKLI